MKIVLATSNQDKVKEIKQFYDKLEVYALCEVMKPFEIIENGYTFQENALIKARSVYAKLCEMGLDKEFISLSDDSGINVDALGGRPGIYSARFGGEHGDDATNRNKMASELDNLNLDSSSAFYTACIAICTKCGEFSTHGFLHGRVINEQRGQNGFGYDFMFIPNGFNKTVGELDMKTKLQISHRSKGLRLMQYILKSVKKQFDR